MSEERIPVTPYQVKYRCEKCGVGFMRGTGESYMSDPPLYPHICDAPNCSHMQTFKRTYPGVVFVGDNVC